MLVPLQSFIFVLPSPAGKGRIFPGGLDYFAIGMDGVYSSSLSRSSPLLRCLRLLRLCSYKWQRRVCSNFVQGGGELEYCNQRVGSNCSINEYLGSHVDSQTDFFQMGQSGRC